MIRRELPYPQENGVVKSLTGFGALSFLSYGRHQSQKHGAWNLNVASVENQRVGNLSRIDCLKFPKRARSPEIESAKQVLWSVLPFRRDSQERIDKPRSLPTADRSPS